MTGNKIFVVGRLSQSSLVRSLKRVAIVLVKLTVIILWKKLAPAIGMWKLHHWLYRPVLIGAAKPL